MLCPVGFIKATARSIFRYPSAKMALVVLQMTSRIAFIVLTLARNMPVGSLSMTTSPVIAKESSLMQKPSWCLLSPLTSIDTMHRFLPSIIRRSLSKSGVIYAEFLMSNGLLKSIRTMVQPSSLGSNVRVIASECRMPRHSPPTFGEP